MPSRLLQTSLLVCLASCAPALDRAGNETGEAPVAEPTTTSREPSDDRAPSAAEPEPVVEADPIRQRLQPWHHVADSITTSAAVVVIATYEQGRYPCVHVGRTRRVPLARTFVIQERLRGNVARDAFNFELPWEPSLQVPEDLERERRYLVFLAPTPESQERLQDGSHIYSLQTQLNAEEVLAIIDLDQSEAEAREHRQHVEQQQSFQQSSFTAEGWHQLRSATTVDLVEAGRYMYLIRETLLRTWRRRNEARAVLGEPDATRREGANVVDVYHLNLAARGGSPLPEGTMLGRIELTFVAATDAFREYSEHYDIAADGGIREATHAEYTGRGLTTVTVDYGGTSRR